MTFSRKNSECLDEQCETAEVGVGMTVSGGAFAEAGAVIQTCHGTSVCNDAYSTEGRVFVGLAVPFSGQVRRSNGNGDNCPTSCTGFSYGDGVAKVNGSISIRFKLFKKTFTVSDSYVLFEGGGTGGCN